MRNGIEYYYAIVAYDRGFSDPNNPDSPPIDPQENVFNISATQAGDVLSVSRNAAVVIPRASAAGFQEGGANEDLSKVTGGVGTGSIAVRSVTEDDLDPSSVYQISFFSQAQDGGTVVKQTAEAGLSLLIIGTTEWLGEAFPELATESAMNAHKAVWISGFSPATG